MQYKTISQISASYDIRYHTIRSRLKKLKGIRTRRIGNMTLVHVDDINKLTRKVARSKSHGMARTWIYSRWTSLLHYHRGEVCDRWQDFELFLEDMGEPPDRNHRLGRINPESGWEPNNCEWKLQ